MSAVPAEPTSAVRPDSLPTPCPSESGLARSDLPDSVQVTEETLNGDRRIYARTFRPKAGAGAVPTWARLVLLHGYGDHGGRYAHFLSWLAARGIACCSLDFRGHGRSLGRRGFVCRWEEYLDDLDEMLDWEQARASRAQGVDDAAGDGPTPSPRVSRFLLAHSHGGLVAAAAGIAGRIEPTDCAGCILTAPYLRPRTALGGFWSAFAKAANRLFPWLRVRSGLSPEMMSSDAAMCAESRADPLLLRSATPRWYVQMLRVQDEVRRDADRFRLPLLCLMGDADPVADPEAAAEFVRNVTSADRTLHRYAGHLHELLREKGREAIFHTILDWMRARADRADRADRGGP